MKSFHDGKVILHAGDCMDVLRTMPADSIDAVVTDPPYHLTSIVKRFGAEGAKPPIPGVFNRSSRGFMGRQWDGGDIAFTVDLWAEILRVLKPGGHLSAFGGDRTHHRLFVAIEDAGFEIRHTIAWVTGQSFPKAHNLKNHPICSCEDGGNTVPNSHDKSLPKRNLRPMRNPDVSPPINIGEKQGKVLQHDLQKQSSSELWAERSESKISTESEPFLEGRQLHRTGEGLPNDLSTRSSESEEKRICSGTHPNNGDGPRSSSESRRRGTSLRSQQVQQSSIESETLSKPFGTLDGRALHGCGQCERCGKLRKEFEGYSTALKTAAEFICLARKPLSESTVAANVLRWGTGALNIDGCRIATSDKDDPRLGGKGSWTTSKEQDGNTVSLPRGTVGSSPLGRWPANLCHDGSPEVLAGFPETNGGQASGYNWEPSNTDISTRVLAQNIKSGMHFGDTGSAARFFYTSKADANDRLNSKHPTVKPVDLMQWLVRLVCPKGATVLDPFAGTGTTGAAAFIEGRQCVLIEREAEYLADIERRMGMLLSGQDERARKLATPDPHDTLPLFAVMP